MLVAAAGTREQSADGRRGVAGARVLPVSPQTLGEQNVSVPLAMLLSQLIRLNVLLAVFNMIPIPPLDGGNVLAGLLPPSMAAHRSTACGRTVSSCCTRSVLTNGFALVVMPPYHFILSLLPTR